MLGWSSKKSSKTSPRRHSHGNWGTLELAEAAAAVLCGVAWEAQGTRFGVVKVGYRWICFVGDFLRIVPGDSSP